MTRAVRTGGDVCRDLIDHWLSQSAYARRRAQDIAPNGAEGLDKGQAVHYATYLAISQTYAAAARELLDVVDGT